MLATKEEIYLTSLKIDNFPVDIPSGLSELLANAWVENKPAPTLKGYEREVSKKDGRYVTFLTKTGG